MEKSNCILCLHAAVLVFLVNQGPYARAITLGQVDDFQGVATQDWGNFSFAPTYPLNSGPAGIGDTSMFVMATGGAGAGSRLIVPSTVSRWTGDYTAAQVTSIMADVNNFHSSPITLRAAVNGSGGAFSSSTGIVLPALSGWQSVSFPLDDMVSVNGAVCCPTGFDLDMTMANVTQFRILHNPIPNWLGLVIDADFGLDNVTAAARCDLDGDLACGLADVNLMFDQGDLVAGVGAAVGSKFDLDNDNDIDNLDLDELLEKTAKHNGYSSAFLRGDTDNLDSTDPPGGRTVDITDFQNFLVGFTGSGDTWEVGNFNGDSGVDITDFSIHFLPSFVLTGGGTYGAGQVIPEPSTALLLGLGILLSYVACRRRRNLSIGDRQR